MKALVTGINGFAGRYLIKELQLNGYEVIGIGTGDFYQEDVHYKEIDILNIVALHKFIKTERPELVFHLAGISSVQHSWQNPAKTFEINVIGTINLLNALQSISNRLKKAVFVGSSDEYGPGRVMGEAFREDDALWPQNPYADSKAAAERVALQMAEKNLLPLVWVRSFNHIGVGQALGFVVPDFSKQVIQSVKEQKPVRVGRLDVFRDFTDVRDVVKAYRLLADEGKPGEVYNVCSGKAYKIADILDMMLRNYGNLRIEMDENKLRPTENIYAVGDNSKIRDTVNWAPIIDIEESVHNVLTEWEEKLNLKSSEI